MFIRRARNVLDVALVLGVLGAAVARAQDAPAAPAAQPGAELSLAELLRGRRAAGDPALEDLAALIAELRARPAASTLAGAELDAAARATEQVRSLLLQRADAARVVRAKQIAWAALSLADRVLARADATGALRAAQAHAQHAGVPASNDARLPQPSAATLAVPQLRALVPDFLARAERARSEARQADQAEVRADHEARARLLMAAAVAEAERVALMRRSAAIESQAQRADQAQVQAALAREQEAERQADARAAQLASDEAASAFAEAVAGDTERPRPRAQRQLARERAALFFVERARLTLAAAVALHAQAAVVSTAERDIGAGAALAAAHRDALPAALRALASSARALGDARARAAQPSPVTGADLVARMAELGLVAECGPRGAVVALPAFFAGVGTQLAPALRPKLVLLRALLAAYPHGSVDIEPGASSTTRGQRLAARRAAVVRALLAEGVAPARVRVLAAKAPVSGLAVPASAPATDSDDLALILPAYAMLLPQ